MCLSKNIKYLRLKKNFSQEYIAKKLGYKSYTTIQKWESGVSEPPVAKLRMLADLLGVDINDLATRDLTVSEASSTNPDTLSEGAQNNVQTMYYTNHETAKMAQEMFEDPQMRALFHMKKGMDPEKFQAHYDMMKKMYELEHPEDTDDFDGC